MNTPRVVNQPLKELASELCGHVIRTKCCTYDPNKFDVTTMCKDCLFDDNNWTLEREQAFDRYIAENRINVLWVIKKLDHDL